MKTFVADFETFYDKEVSITTMGVARYVRETDIYLVSIFGDGFCWVGEPRNAPWEILRGQQVIAHNAAFDMAVVEELRRRGMPIPEFGDVNCSANLSAYLQAPRNLAGAAKELLGISLDKGMRDWAKGKKWGEMPEDKKIEMAKYAALDSKAAWLLWNQHSGKWPDNEQYISQHTMGMTDAGIHVDREGAEKARNELLKMLHAAEANIPWASELDSKGKPVPVTSPKQIALWCRKFDVPPPTTTDTKSDEFDQWAEQYADRAQFVAAVQQWRSANRLLKVVETMLARSLEGGRMPYSLKYFGAQHTGRWSGDSGLNCQNFPRKALGGVDVRGLLVPKPGHVFIISDYSAIEPRCLAWLTRNGPLLELLSQGVDIYEAHARATMGYSDPRPLKEVDPEMRALAKLRVLGLGYALGPARAISIVKQWTGKDITPAQSEKLVRDFRNSNPLITKLWTRMDRVIRGSIGGTAEVELPSGRVIRYFDVEKSDGNLTVRVVQGEAHRKIFGGMAVENLVQATAREVLADGILKLEKAGIPVVLHVHDEVVAEVEEDQAEDALAEVRRIMSTPPDFMPDLPLACEARIAHKYGK